MIKTDVLISTAIGSLPSLGSIAARAKEPADAWIYVPKSNCQQIAGGTLSPPSANVK